MQSDSSNAIQTENDNSRIVSSSTCPRSTIFLIHIPYHDRYELHFLNRYDDLDLGENDAIVYTSLISDFTPYFIYLEEDEMNRAIDVLGSLITESIELSCKGVFTETVPMQIKKIYRRALRVYNRIAHGCFLTNVFLRKLWNLTYGIWKFTSVYRVWVSRQSQENFSYSN